ncbi:hypothetical protein [Thermococcus sp. Bubb.Bath]|uniref:hypothetical protein n=2 Tax=unclassified Thermococcus TaxID=2627626 RepID=UPI00143C240E|nr:hypothetical protein [Thermococcus sp. Bubb.Bath]NJF25768.1 hypothetical protein [Thermococcus sp. Bubb.Bath]
MRKTFIFPLLIVALLLVPFAGAVSSFTGNLGNSSSVVTGEMTCIPQTVRVHGSVMCDLELNLTKNESVTVELKRIYLNGKLVWSQNTSSESVRVVNPRVSLGPTNVMGDSTIVITLNDEFADSYFGKPVLDSYTDKLAGRTFRVTVVLDGMENPVVGTFKVKELGYMHFAEDILAYLFILALGIAFAFVPKWSYSLGAGIFSFGLVGYIAKIASESQWILRYGGSPDFVFLVLLIPIVFLTTLLSVKNRSGGIIGLFLWTGLLVVSKYGDNGCVMAFVFSLALWILVETQLFSLGHYRVSRVMLFELGTVIPLLPYAVPLMYWALVILPGWAFWIFAISFFVFGGIIKEECLMIITCKSPYWIVYPSFLIVLAFTNSPFSLVYLLPAFRVHQISKMLLEDWRRFVSEPEN